MIALAPVLNSGGRTRNVAADSGGRTRNAAATSGGRTISVAVTSGGRTRSADAQHVRRATTPMFMRRLISMQGWMGPSVVTNMSIPTMPR